MQQQQVTRNFRTTRHHQVFKTCTMVTFIMAFGLTCVAVFTLYRYNKFDRTDWDETHGELKKAYDYFDTNRGAQGILSIRNVAADKTDCTSLVTTVDGVAGTEFTLVKSVFTLPGIRSGCINDDKITQGLCSGTAVATGSDIIAMKPIVLNQWSNKQFCVLRTKAHSLQLKDADACPTSWKNCGNYCYEMPTGWTGGDCPYTDWKLAHAAVTGYTEKTSGETWGTDNDKVYFKIQTADEATVTASVGFNAEFYGDNSCVNPGLHPVDPVETLAASAVAGTVAKSIQYPLTIAYKQKGCGTTLKADSLCTVAATQNEWAFLTGNTNTAVNRTLPKFQTTVSDAKFSVRLLNRQRIKVKRNKACDDWRFNSNKHATNLLKEFDQTWDLVKWVAVVTLSCSFLSVMMVLTVIMAGYRKQTQNYMTVLYTVCLLGVFISVVMVWKVKYQVDNDYATARKYFQDASTSGCIKNEEWNTLLTQWISHTSFEDLSTQLLSTLVFFVTMLLMAVIFSIWALMQLAATKERRQSQFR